MQKQTNNNRLGDWKMSLKDKYKNYKEVRQNGNSFYTCFIYSLFEFISLNRKKI